jgi:hypothetical protein
VKIESENRKKKKAGRSANGSMLGQSRAGKPKDFLGLNEKNF